MKWKKTLLILAFLLFCSMSILKGQGEDRFLLIETTQSPILDLPQNASLGFAPRPNYFLKVTVTNGYLNSTSCYATVWKKSGSGIFSFLSNDNGTIALSWNSSLPIKLLVNKFPYSAPFNIIDGKKYTINWEFPSISFLDQYFVVGLGLAGLGLTILSPVMMLRIIKEGDLDKAEQAGIWFVLFLVGLGMLIMWLW